MTIPRTPAGGAGDRESVSGPLDCAHDTADHCQSVPQQLRRRRAASWRCPPLADGRRDPLDRSAEPLTGAELESWRLAWLHLHALGLPAVVPQRVLAAAGSRIA